MAGIEAVGGIDDLVAEVRVYKRHAVDVAREGWRCCQNQYNTNSCSWC